MTGLSKWTALLFMLCVLGMSACAGSPPPPAQTAEVRPPQPAPEATWVPGHWVWKGRQLGYVWVPGHWSP